MFPYSPALLACTARSEGASKVVWDCGIIVNQRGRSPRQSGDVKPCFSGHTGAISAPRDD
jgi:hypothetical protein